MRRPSFIGPDRFGALVALLLGAFVLAPLLQESQLGGIALGLVVALVLVAALTACGLDTRTIAIGGIFSAVGVVVTGTGSALVDGAMPAWVSGLFAAVLAGTTVLVLRRILQHRQVTLSTVAGALCAYLMVGMAFASLYRTVSIVDVDAFTEPLESSSTYFSFVTLTTLGYGDINPVSEFARSLSVLEAVLGQVLLVVLVARFVSTLGQPTRRAQRTPDAEPAPDGTDGT